MLVVNHYAVMMSEELWDDPQTYRPERFIKNGVVEIPEAFIAFGLGEFRKWRTPHTVSTTFSLVTSFSGNIFKCIEYFFGWLQVLTRGGKPHLSV